MALRDLENLSARDRVLDVPGDEADESGRRRFLAAVAHRFRPAVVLPGALGIAAFVGSWELVALHNPSLIPTVGQIASSLVDNPHLYWLNTATTLRETVVGLLGSFVVAFSAAVLMCHAKAFERAVMPLAVILNVTPIVAITPALVIALGFGSLPKYVITAMIVFFPLLINSLVGLRSVDPSALDFLRTLHASRREILWRLRLPSCLPFLFAALRVCVPLSLIGAVVAEYLASGQARGLGSMISIAQGYSDTAMIYAATFILAVLGLVFTLAVVVAEASILSWHVSIRRS
ncbi:MAG TPA: ABC transporter permease [Acidimicrobiales bacterium]|nr:ABC transporter permease [Acidimicrobiales bacterium]